MPFSKKRREKSPSSTPVPTTEDGGAQLPEKEWEAMTKVLNAIYDYRTEDGFDPSKLFHKKVNKRALPEYYDTIKEPMALSVIKQKVHARAYPSFADYVRDFALIPHNAMLFNTPKSGAYQDALVIKEQLEKSLQELVSEGVIDKATATLPDLGEIPAYEDVPEEEPEEEEEDSDEDAEEEEEDEDDDGAVPQKRKRGRPSLQKRETGDDTGAKRTRGRPPKLLTPMEARIQAVLKGIRKPKNSRGLHMIRHFERLPDKVAFPDYYVEVKNPMAYDLLKRKVKRKKYATLELFLNDVNLMFDNAKRYNEDDSQIFKDAVALQIEAGRLYDIEKTKSDSSFVDEEGKMPLPEGILHNGELYKVGDWVHIQNPNDLTKPIPSQIYRTYRSPSGQAMVNVCWYYRPEQTVHRFDKHFYDHEVVKTGRYRDHLVEEIEGRCFIMFTTRYFKGRPRGLATGTEIYVCEARYNEEKALFNKVKTWTSCLPDEVRDRDYDMDLYEQPKRMKKYPSPIRYLLKDDQKETDDLPKPEWGAEKAPPKIGAVHRRTRTDRDSPPPEPTPPPPAVMPSNPSQPSRSVSTGFAAHLQRPIQTTFKTSFGPSNGAYNQTPNAQAPLQRTANMQTNYAPLTPQPNLARGTPQTTNTGYGPTASMQPTPAATYPPRPGMASTTSYRDPPPIEVYTLPDAANLSIPAEVREQYRRDDQGRILFFTAPPVLPVDDGLSKLGGHSVRYLAAKARRADSLAAERIRREAEENDEHLSAKRRKVDNAQKLCGDLEKLSVDVLETIEWTLSQNIKHQLTGEELELAAKAQAETEEEYLALQRQLLEREASRKVALYSDVYHDDLDTRIT